MSEDLYYLGFSQFPGIGPRIFAKLLKEFGTAKKAWTAPDTDLLEVLKDILTAEFVDFRNTFDVEKCKEELEEKEIEWVTTKSHLYPKLLKQSLDHPFLLYYKGSVDTLNSEKSIAVVGTRKVTDYGHVVTEMLTEELVQYGFTIVSGLALGVDALAHKTAVKAKGLTIAVLGCGVDLCYPRENQAIYDAILASGGTIVSTFLPGQGATIGSFPARNATIAGLSMGVVVTEGAEDSGALITAKDAKKLGRPVFAVPGPITSFLSKGTNNLLKTDGIPTTSAMEILDSLDIMTQVKTHPPAGGLKVKSKREGTKEEQIILDMLQYGPLHFDEIARRMEKDSKTVGSLLSLMELKGFVKSIQGSMYSI